MIRPSEAPQAGVGRMWGPLAPGQWRWLSPGMTKTSATGPPIGPRSARRNARAERLKAALKANLRRRKAQARERAAEAEGSGCGTEPAGAHDSARVVVDKRPG
jgi:hypothetical protein